MVYQNGIGAAVATVIVVAEMMAFSSVKTAASSHLQSTKNHFQDSANLQS